ncbi:MAG: large-conductance mechanosensitive channel protein MscL [Oscillospiraceae bacterium]|nr:large-conductance mechanosensitive channel protein MscL [Oscillospiraceae bacterium]
MEKKGFVQEFKTFISRGNVVDMAVGVIIGSAFTKIVNSLVNDVLMPALGVLTGGVNFADLKFVITPATEEVAEVAIKYGAFVQNIIDFLLIAIVVFVMVKMINKIRDMGKEETAE